MMAKTFIVQILTKFLQRRGVSVQRITKKILEDSLYSQTFCEAKLLAFICDGGCQEYH